VRRQSDWAVNEGTLTISVDQFGQTVEGTFADWTAEIAFSETPTDGKYGDVIVTIAIPSLTLASLTSEALDTDFLDVENFSVATFQGPITHNDTGYVVDGTLTLVGQTMPMPLPFELVLEGDLATAQGTGELDRRDFGIGQSYSDESTVGFKVGVQFTLSAVRTDQS